MTTESPLLPVAAQRFLCDPIFLGAVTISGLRLIGSQNIREHHMARARRVKKERSIASLYCRARLLRPLSHQQRYVVRMTRVSPRKTDSDNLQGSCKAVRDGVADWLSVDDGDESKVLWEYGQIVGKCAVVIEIWSGE